MKDVSDLDRACRGYALCNPLFDCPEYHANFNKKVRLILEFFPGNDAFASYWHLVLHNCAHLYLSALSCMRENDLAYSMV